MQILKEETRKKIESSAVDIFLQKGFERASMQNIAKKAKISVSNIYNYFESKEKLFYAIVDPVYYQLNQLMQGFMENETDRTFTNGNFIKQFIQTITKEIGIFIKKNRVQVLLLFDKSRGTKYEQLKGRLIDFLEDHFTSGLKNKQTNETTSFIMHISATNLIEGLLEIVRHYRNEEWVDNSVKEFIKYHIHGIAQFFE